MESWSRRTGSKNAIAHEELVTKGLQWCHKQIQCDVAKHSKLMEETLFSKSTAIEQKYLKFALLWKKHRGKDRKQQTSIIWEKHSHFNNDFKDAHKEKNEFLTNAVNLNILNVAAWAPSSSDRVPMTLPTEIAEYILPMEEFYTKWHKGRKLQW